VLPRLASRRCPSPAISFSVRFLIPALLRAVGPPTSLFQDLLASLAKVASDGGEINRSPQSCIHLNCRVICALPEAPHRFVDSSGLRQATCGRGWSTASTTLSGTRPSVLLCRVLTPYPKSFFLVLQNTKTQACAFFLMCPRSGKLLPESGNYACQNPASPNCSNPQLKILATSHLQQLELVKGTSAGSRSWPWRKARKSSSLGWCCWMQRRCFGGEVASCHALSCSFHTHTHRRRGNLLK